MEAEIMEHKLSPHEKAACTDKWAETMTKWLITFTNRKLSKQRWQIVSFRGPNKGESRGIVDIIAIRKNHKYHSKTLKIGDLFEIVLIQVKGGRARDPSEDDKKRMLEVGKYYHAKCCILSRWKRRELQSVSLLDESSLKWNKIEPEEIFK
ncbi:MAG: hypothetical protein ABID87_06115 [Chloroflexota bacterium]